MSKTDGKVEQPSNNHGEDKPRGSGSNSRRSGNKSNDDHSFKRKSGSSSQHTRHHGSTSGKDSRSGGGSNRSGNSGGSRDSTHPHGKSDRYKNKDTSADHGSSSSSSNRHGNKGGGRDGWTNPSSSSRAHRSNSGGEGGGGGGGGPRKGHKVHSNKNKAMLEAKDSGISVDGNSSPEGVASKQQQQKGGESAKDGECSMGKKVDGSHVAGTVKEDSGSSSVEKDNVTKSVSFSNLNSENGTNINKEPSKGCEDKSLASRYVYDREFLLEFKDCTKSLLTPAGFDKLLPEISKDILRSSRRHSVIDDTSDTKEDDSVRHTGSLSFSREYHLDQKNNSKVSLMPQRRSFGSGCSWRDHPVTKNSSTSQTPVENQPKKADESGNNSDGSGGGGWSVVGGSGGQHGGTHSHKVIDHVPYRSRQGESGGGEWKQAKPSGSNWRARNKQEQMFDDDQEEDEPEWMSFGPSDRYELMELKGIDEHEMEREARNAETKLKSDEKSSPEESPSTSPLDKDLPKNDFVDSGLPSSCPVDDEDDRFMLDGFDFKSVLSICQELASDSGDEVEHVDRDSLSKAKDTHELKNALISVLGITKEEKIKQEAQMKMARSKEVEKRALTLDEIEGQMTTASRHQTIDQSDQSAFNKFLATMNNQPSHLEQQPEHVRSFSGNELTDPCTLELPLSSVSTNKSLFRDDSSSPVFSDFPSVYHQKPHSYSSVYSSQPVHHTPSNQTKWPLPSSTSASSWNEVTDMHSKTSSSQLLNPSPSSLGIHPHHLRQQKQQSLGVTAGGGSGIGSSSGAGNSNWVMEMEHQRVTELNQMRYHQQQQQYRDERQAARMLHLQHHSMQQQKSPTPSLSFLPTSVMRHMHNSKPNQSLKDITRTVPHSSTGRFEQDTGMAGSTGGSYVSMQQQSSSETSPFHTSSFHQPSLPPTSPHYHHYPPHPPQSHQYHHHHHPHLPAPTTGYHSSLRDVGSSGYQHQASLSSHPQFPPQYMKTGGMKPTGLF